MSTGELMTAEEARAWRDDGVDGNRDEIARLCDTIIALHGLLGAAARGELPRCDDCGTRLATLRWADTSDCMCDECLRELRYEQTSAGESLDEAACVDLPHAAALRAAMGGAA